MKLKATPLTLSAILTSPVAIADPIEPGAEHCVVNVRADDRLNLRAGPGTGYRVLAHLYDAGWARRRYLAMVSPTIHCPSPSEAGRPVPTRAWPSERSRVLTTLDARRCDIALLPFRTDGWQKIRQGGWAGWVDHFDLVYMDSDRPKI